MLKLQKLLKIYGGNQRSKKMFKGFAVNQQSSMAKLKKEIEGYVESKSKSPRTPKTGGRTSDSGRNRIG